jgi:Zn-dependent protease/predicted transcriptional regulator
MRAFHLMRIAGIRIVIDPTWLFVFVLVVISLAGSYVPEVAPHLSHAAAWLVGVVAALCLFASVLLHELSHALLARRAGIKVPRIRLFLFGGISEMAAEPHEPRAELRIAAAGPITSLALGSACLLLIRTVMGAEPTGPHILLQYVASTNLLLGLFNLMPGLPLDGGRMLRAWLWSRHGNLMRATRTAGRAGVAIGYLFIALGLVSLVLQGFLSGIWFLFIGAFLARAAASSYQAAMLRDMLSGVRVRQLMTRDVVTVEDHISLEELVHDHFLLRPHSSYPAMNVGRLVGMIAIGQVRQVPRDQWVRTPVRQVMTSVERCPPVRPEDECLPILERMIRDDLSPLPVEQEGRLVGILSRRDMLQLFRIRSSLASG